MLAAAERPLSRKPQKPYSPDSKRAKAMTIGIGFHCLDGIIMGSDRQMTAQERHKFPEKKLFYDLKDERTLALIGGNELGLAKEVWWKLLDYPISDYESCEQALTSVLDNMGRLYTDLPLELLCGLATKTDTYLLGFRGKGIFPILDELGVICAGDSSLIRYLVKHIELFWTTANSVVIATYLLKRAEEFVDGCKGPMDVILLKPGPRIQTFDPEIIDDLDRQIAKNHAEVFKNLLSLSPPFST